MPTWLLARHGRTEWNVEGRRQGRLDSPLTPDGHRDAERIATLAAGRAVDRVLSSPLGRAHATAVIVGDRIGVGVTMLDDLAELDHGDLSGLTDAEIETRFPGVLAQRTRDKYRWRFPGGESYADAAGRAAQAIEQIGDRSRRPLVVAHEMIARMLMMHLLRLEPAAALEWRLPHGELVELDVARGSAHGPLEGA
ncbi:MAG: histidine phosphatase family protein [Ilumatobacter sp.]|uniref:histidine phosphatase family protein n=1 Tax=Ilumatobacter sp. TaxID=1967498 RepID=UPI00260BE86F|nr:histidine phosphatase family protein [Ilumatobacter sp.]MDJ0768931.1 histidine phosphatase family protein [Ilumatobacter sp.]